MLEKLTAYQPDCRGNAPLAPNRAFSKWDQTFKDAMETAAAITWQSTPT